MADHPVSDGAIAPDVDVVVGAWPFYDDDEIAAAMCVLESGKVNQWTGDRVRHFEQVFARHFGAPYAVAVFNGTVALELALRALDIGPGDEVIVASRSFVASASCVLTVGAKPVFADIDPESHAMTVATIAPLMTSRTRAVIPVHLAGWPADMPAILDFARRHSLFVIEDCAQAHGAAIDDRLLGSFGHAAAFSFCQDKIMSTGGEGGMVLFQDQAAHARAWSYKDHGKNAALALGPTSRGQFRYVHQTMGTNWRMTELQAAIGIRQLDKLDGWVKARTRNAAQWRRELAAVTSLAFAQPDARFRHAYYRAIALLQPERLNLGGGSLAQAHTALLARLAAANVPVTAGGCPEIYREALFAGYEIPTRPVAHLIGQRSLAFPVHPTLSSNSIGRYASRVASEINAMTRA
jgi:dTDP-4-amino-4,6-dideoxygalactose transaminase